MINNKILPTLPEWDSNYLPKSAISSTARKSRSNISKEFLSMRPKPLKSYVPIIEIRHGFKHYSFYNFWNQVLRDLNLKIYPGEIYAILGPKASGKTTISRALIGIIPLNQGEIRISKKKFSMPLYNCKVGYMPQNLGLDLCLTMSETFAYYGRLFNLSSQYIQVRKMHLTTVLDLPKHDFKLAHYDENILQRLSFALAILHEPELLIIDEPTQGINPKIVKRIWTILRDLSATKNSTVILTTINSTEAQKADRVGILYGGQIVVEGSPQLLVARNDLTHLEEVYAKAYTHERHYLITNVSITEGRERSSSTDSHLFNIRGTSLREIQLRNIIEYDSMEPSNKAIILGVCRKICGIFKINLGRVLWINWIDCKRVQRNWITLLLVELFLFMAAYIFGYISMRTDRVVPIAVFNGDTDESYECNSETARLISCQILNKFNSTLVQLTLFKSLKRLRYEEGLGNFPVYMIIPKGFTYQFYQDMTSQLYYKQDPISKYADKSIEVIAEGIEITTETILRNEISKIRKLFFNDIVLQNPLNSEEYPIEIINDVPLVQANLICLGIINAYCHYSTMLATIYYKVYERDQNLEDIKKISGVKSIENFIAISLGFGLYTVLKCFGVTMLLFHLYGVQVRPAWGTYFFVLIFQIFLSYALGLFLVAISRETFVIMVLFIYYIFCTNYLGGVFTSNIRYNKRLHQLVTAVYYFTSFHWVNEACRAIFFEDDSTLDSAVSLCILANFMLGIVHLSLAKIFSPITFRKIYS